VSNADDDSAANKEAFGRENLPEGIENEVSLIFSSHASILFAWNQIGEKAGEQ